MPELPEADRAATDIQDAALDSTIQQVETNSDDLVFSGITNEEFAAEITGRKLLGVKRYGKVFYFELDGEGRQPVFHFGMTGRIHINGRETLQYKEGPKNSVSQWPPKYMKCIIHFVDKDGHNVEIAYSDPRRLGRIRLCADPPNEPPISQLGFDPIHSMPPFEDYRPNVICRSCPVKSLLLDQAFNAGVGNWVADEILYNSHIHPEQRCNTLSEAQIREMHRWTSEVCRIAISVRAESTQFPPHWLFNHRWDKGKKKDPNHKPLLLPSGLPATIKFITVGGRTSAFVAEVQKLAPRPKRSRSPQATDEHSSPDEGQQRRSKRRKESK